MCRQPRQQLALPLGITEVPEQLLRAAYARCELAMSFDEAMQKEVLRICFRAMARRAYEPKRGKK
ncbi:hypothetical protein SAMN05720354_103129 [Nitrosospira sp. Nsp1]|nr:hypothetical protein SAMN05720354_103129 [Nitrosospira sp. Nsp1]